jgi:hypothetical protein
MRRDQRTPKLLAMERLMRLPEFCPRPQNVPEKGSLRECGVVISHSASRYRVPSRELDIQSPESRDRPSRNLTGGPTRHRERAATLAFVAAENGGVSFPRPLRPGTSPDRSTSPYRMAVRSVLHNGGQKCSEEAKRPWPQAPTAVFGRAVCRNCPDPLSVEYLLGGTSRLWCCGRLK